MKLDSTRVGPCSRLNIKALGPHTKQLGSENVMASEPQTDDRQLWAELLMSPDGTAHFKWHIEGLSFAEARAGLKQFIALMQGRLDDQQRCPFYQPEVTSEIHGRQKADG